MARINPHRSISIYKVALLVMLFAGVMACAGGQRNSVLPTNHSVTLSWAASSTPNVQYNVYRGGQHLGPYPTKLNSAPLSTAGFTDSTVQNGATYYYVVTSVDTNSVESGYSNEATASVPGS